MVGAGNDFIIVDALQGFNFKRLSIKICDRTNGIGADGLLVCGKSKKANFRMRIINADGSEAEMCGNGARCMAAYIVKNKRTKNKLFSIETISGIILADAKNEIANVRLSAPLGYKMDIPLTISRRKVRVSFIDTGVPHVIIYVNNLKKINVGQIGRIIRFHKKFQPKGANVNFVEQIKNNLVDVRTYERGVEAETKACGTGSVAVAIITYLKMHPDLQNKESALMNVRTKSGEILKIVFDLKFGCPENIWLKGSAKFIASGEYVI